MEGRRPSLENYAETSSPHPPKRQKTFHHNLDIAVHELRNGSPGPQYDRYTISWICALPIEMAAARAMLDEIHEFPTTHENDTNTYVLGTVKQHNVVLACLPTAQYGTNNAANVLTHLIRTFPSIRVGLMVGIGGGVPSMADIRLGDIVVGTRVMQYDLGKIIGDGQLQRTAIPKIPHQSLGTVVSTLRSEHELKPSQVASILREKLEKHSGFDQIDSRKLTIKNAHAKTCQWFLNHPSYQTWLDPGRLAEHHGFLWMRGKPGAGKSTIMKFAYLHMKRKVCGRLAMTASFFFNARGEHLERSIGGMYRSLLLQLLEGFPDLQVVFDDPDLVARNQSDCPSLDVLKNLFRSAVSALGQRSLTCFVDALDECDEQQVMDMVQYFEELAEHSTSRGVQLRICFSSRHYPYIDIRQGIPLTLEDQPGQAKDLENYVGSRLRIKNPALVEELRPQILGKATGIFLWVILVVDILNKEKRHGLLALRKRLGELPPRLSELFKDILMRDKENMEHLLLSILWILYAKRPLRPEEYYHALWSGLSPNGLVDPEVPDVTASNADDCVVSCIISYSKGLAEITKSKQPTVQFIHESVGDFFIKDKGLQELWPDLGFDWESPGHERLKQCCNTYMNHPLVRASVSNLLSEAKANGCPGISEKYPFLEYASRHVLSHADAAAVAFPQGEFLSGFPVSDWININNMFEKFKVRKYSLGASLLYILAEKGFPRLIRTKLEEDPRIHIRGERYQYPLLAALANGHHDAVVTLLDLLPRIWGTEFVNVSTKSGQTPLLMASEKGHEEAVARLLIDKGADVNASDKSGRTPLSYASSKGQEAIARLLIDKGADINISDKSGWILLPHALLQGQEAIARLLIDKGANVNASDGSGWTPLLYASWKGQEAMARLLIDKGADINASDKSGRTPLLYASTNGREAVARLLIDKGVDVNASTKSGQTLLLIVLKRGQKAMAKLFINKGADVNANDEYGRTPLSYASSKGQKAIARLLIDKGADVNASDKSGQIPLLYALLNDHEAVARLLIDKGADVNASTKSGQTPLLITLERGH
ncbi:hypothetical protein DL771_006893 [Monosporascus sp. 5C6A]|nr:hypothetical protein DL771_006893 [Monosporascus sp. 5C6A]